MSLNFDPTNRIPEGTDFLSSVDDQGHETESKEIDEGILSAVEELFPEAGNLAVHWIENIKDKFANSVIARDTRALFKESKMDVEEMKRKVDAKELLPLIREDREGEKPIFHAPVEIKKLLEGVEVELHRMSDKGKVLVERLQSHEFTVKSLSEDQYSRIRNAASSAFSQLAEAYKKQEGLKDNLRNYTFTVHIRDASPDDQGLTEEQKKILNLKMKELEANLRNQADQEKIVNKETTKILDKKSDDKKAFYHEQDEAKEIIKENNKQNDMERT